MSESELPQRPDDARLAEGETFRPWYKEDDHIHVENGSILGIHAHGELSRIQEQLARMVAHEKELVGRFGGDQDIMLDDALGFLGEWEC